MPRMSLLKLFGCSPIRPLQQHMEKVNECVSELHSFFQLVMKEDWAAAKESRRHIALLENEADTLKRNLRLHLPTGLFMPVERSDVLELVTRQDLLANRAKDIAGMTVGRQMIFPQIMREDFINFLEHNIKAAGQAFKAISELDKVFEVGFSGQELIIVEEMIDQLLAIERDADKMEVQLRQTLFSMEEKLPPVHVMFLYKVIEWTGDLSNRAQHIGDGLQILIAQ